MISQWITAVSILYFNSHTRVGCDADAHKQLQLDDAISTHTPRVGCDPIFCGKYKVTHIYWGGLLEY